MAFEFCGVGHREVPEEIAPWLVWAGHVMALLGGVLATGDAIGSDALFLEGYEKGKSPTMPPAKIYFTRLKNPRNLPHDPTRGWYEAEQYASFEQAKEFAYEARGSFEGLYPSGIALHGRNAFQILDVTLDKPRWILLFYARPSGKKGRVFGGTNTALQIARRFDIREVNFHHSAQREKFYVWATDQLIGRGMAVPPIGVEGR